jgi:FKBP-type peptidyl-prolyl cis-trans isomerase FklB
MKIKRVHDSRLLIALVSVLLGGCEQALSDEHGSQAAADVPLTEELDRASYLLGYQQTKNLAQQTQGVVNLEAYIAGIRDFAAERDSRVGVSEQQALMTALNNAVVELQQVANSAVVEAGQALLAENGARDGVTTLPSGLQYEVIAEGEGPKPGAADTVVTHYRGTLPDGTEFDSSYSRNQPASFRVDRVIAGWTEALQLMSVGSKWRLVIPSNLAYGERGSGAMIPPDATLVFEVELLEIQ